ncbi:MAG: hypothetical protein N2C12_18890, partial [Planctomycetales bacterium]
MADEVEKDATSKPQRLCSLDVYRGAIMFFLAASSVALTPALISSFFPENTFWEFCRTQWQHANWRISISNLAALQSWQDVSFRLWELIQPSFMFMVGVSMPYSYGKRLESGQSYGRMFGHAVYRAMVLILLGIFLRSLSNKTSTYWTFEDVITQIGLGYVFLFLLWNRDWKIQAVAAGLILIGYWALWQYWPSISAAFGIEPNAVAGWPVSDKYERIARGNPGCTFDVWLLNLTTFGRGFIDHDYYTLNFIPSLVTMIFGLMAGHLLRGTIAPYRKLAIMLIAGVVGVALGLVLDWFGICPMIKKIWTSSWTVFSGGLCVLFLAGFYWTIDVMGYRRWTLPFVVFGMNSIAIYIL